MEMQPPAVHPLDMLNKLIRATNAHDLDALVDCFSSSYRNETPAHPARGFIGAEQVRRNWQQIFAGVADIRADVVRFAAHGDDAWAEMEMKGHRADGSIHMMRGVVIFGVRDGRADWARFYMEQVEDTSGDVNKAVRNAVLPIAKAAP